ncbi:MULTISPECIES: PPA1309 family protein [Aeromicrobium]|uniref:PPA1309 family protein n=1 Tax=Aeromicrobium TaxID=2040 RepID=UPI002580FB7A|nr:MULTISPECIES: PPA1309 family protein [Aeromicrobium]
MSDPELTVSGGGLGADSPVRRAALEVEGHVNDGGWDQAPRLFALVLTADLLAAQPELADELGDPDSYTPIEQELPHDREVEDLLPEIGWPGEVAGCAVVMERITLPAEAEDDLPSDPAAVADFAAQHPDRQEMRIVAAVLRDGPAHVAVRPRASEDAPLIEGPDLVPGLVDLLAQTLAEDS